MSAWDIPESAFDYTPDSDPQASTQTPFDVLIATSGNRNASHGLVAANVRAEIDQVLISRQADSMRPDRSVVGGTPGSPTSRLFMANGVFDEATYVTNTSNRTLPVTAPEIVRSAIPSGEWEAPYEFVPYTDAAFRAVVNSLDYGQQGPVAAALF